MNHDIILGNIIEAIAELHNLRNRLESQDNKPDVKELRNSLRHAYHHLNFAWYIRKIDKEKYINLSERNFRRWGKFPKGVLKDSN